MTTFDLAEVRSFVATLDARMDQCDNGEGMMCATLDDALRHCATLCNEYRETVRQWGRAVFAGRVGFDPEVERVWQDEGMRLSDRALFLLEYSRGVEGPCYHLDGQAILESALWNLYGLLGNWVTPQLAVGPAARQGLAPAVADAEEIRRRIDALPPLPADWRPTDPRDQQQFKRAGGRRPS